MEGEAIDVVHLATSPAGGKFDAVSEPDAVVTIVLVQLEACDADAKELAFDMLRRTTLARSGPPSVVGTWEIQQRKAHTARELPPYLVPNGSTSRDPDIRDPAAGAALRTAAATTARVCPLGCRAVGGLQSRPELRAVPVDVRIEPEDGL